MSKASAQTSKYYRLTAPVDAAFRAVLDRLGATVDAAEKAAEVANDSIDSATDLRELRVSFRAGIDDVTTNDGASLQRAVSEDQPGINLQRVIQCGPCDNAFIDVMDVSNFFVSG